MDRSRLFDRVIDTVRDRDRPRLLLEPNADVVHAVVVHREVDQERCYALDDAGVCERAAVERPEAVDILGQRHDCLLRPRYRHR